MAVVLERRGGTAGVVEQDGSSLEWMPDPKVERLLARLDVEWDYSSININLIDGGKSLDNQARWTDRLVESRVEEYAEAMRRGDTFPALVAHALGDGTFFLNGGNHRLAAAKRVDRTSVAVYLIKTNDAGMRHLVTVLLNTIEGARPSRADLMAQCLDTVQRYGYDLSKAAALFGLPVNAAQTEERRQVTRLRLRAKRIDPEMMPMRTLDAMFKISNDVAFGEAAELLASVKLPDVDVRRFTAEVAAQRTEGGAAGVVQQWRDRDDVKLRKAGLIKVRTTGPTWVRGRLLGSIRAASGVISKHQTRAALGLTNDDDMNQVIEAGYALVQDLEDVRAQTA